MTKLSKREIIIFIMTLVLTVVFIIFDLIIAPLVESGAHIDDKARLTQAHLNKAHQMIAAQSHIQERYQHWVDLFSSAQSEGEEMTTMVSSIESAARESNIHIGNIQPQAISSQKDIAFLPVELAIDGAWLDIVKFIDTLQQSPNFYFVDELNLEKYSETINALRGRIILSCMRLKNP